MGNPRERPHKGVIRAKAHTPPKHQQIAHPPRVIIIRSAFKTKQVFWVPYGWHLMTIGLDEKNTIFHIPMIYDKLLQNVPKEVREPMINVNKDWLDDMSEEP